jgi:hypothetical protein
MTKRVLVLVIPKRCADIGTYKPRLFSIGYSARASPPNNGHFDASPLYLTAKRIPLIRIGTSKLHDNTEHLAHAITCIFTELFASGINMRFSFTTGSYIKAKLLLLLMCADYALL